MYRRGKIKAFVVVVLLSHFGRRVDARWRLFDVGRCLDDVDFWRRNKVLRVTLLTRQLVNVQVIVVDVVLRTRRSHRNDARDNVFPKRRKILDDCGAKENRSVELNRRLPLEIDGLQGEHLAGVSDHVVSSLRWFFA